MKWLKIWPKIKRPKPPSFRTMRWISLALAFIVIALTVIGGPSWLGMINMATSGILIGGFVWMGRIIAMQEAFDKMSDAIHTMSNLNRQLIAGKVKFFIEGGDADAPAEQPARLH